MEHERPDSGFRSEDTAFRTALRSPSARTLSDAASSARSCSSAERPSGIDDTACSAVDDSTTTTGTARAPERVSSAMFALPASVCGEVSSDLRNRAAGAPVMLVVTMIYPWTEAISARMSSTR